MTDGFDLAGVKKGRPEDRVAKKLLEQALAEIDEVESSLQLVT